MKLDIVVCYSILEYCFQNHNFLDIDNKAISIFNEIEGKRVNLNDDLIDHYEDFFLAANPGFLDYYETWIANRMQYSDSINILSNGLANHSVNQLFDDDYLRTLANLAYINDDKIIFSDSLDNYKNQLQNLNILQLNGDEIIDKKTDNYYNRYRFPIFRKVIKKGESSVNLSNWLKRIIQTETDIIIIDNYIYQERHNFKKYFLDHVPANSNIKIYTILEGPATENSLKHEFRKSNYSNWNIEIFLIPGKKDQHARNIITNHYCIQLDKGMRIFGSNGATEQSDIYIDDVSNMTDNSMPMVSKQIL